LSSTGLGGLGADAFAATQGIAGNPLQHDQLSTSEAPIPPEPEEGNLLILA
jgi:hypothetical protein